MSPFVFPPSGGKATQLHSNNEGNSLPPPGDTEQSGEPRSASVRKDGKGAKQGDSLKISIIKAKSKICQSLIIINFFK